MVVISAYSTGMMGTQCSVVRVREDVTCGCGCHVTRDTCTSVHHRYSPHKCQCLCNNAQEAATCSPRHVWDPRVCGCTCRGDTWQMCPTGYLFDSQVTCNCIPVHYQANIPLIIFVLSLVLASVSIVSCGLYHKRRMEMKRRRESLARILEVSAKRTIHMRSHRFIFRRIQMPKTNSYGLVVDMLNVSTNWIFIFN